MGFIRRLNDIPREEYFAPGHAFCAGCGITSIIRMVLKAYEGPKIIVNATGCMEVASTLYPRTAWKVPWIHSAFENAAATAAGIEAAFKILNRKYGYNKKVHVIAFGGDGGTFDIGIQALSGALERGHNFTYICYDNEAYMNTGIQRSGATPMGAATTTSPAGRVIPGKPQGKKDLVFIAAFHKIPYVATLNPAFMQDMYNKLVKASQIEGPKFLHYYTPCPTGWRFDTSHSIKIARLAVQTRFFPLYEIERGKLRITVDIKKPKPLEEYLKLQGRFRHLLDPKNKHIVDALKEEIERNWQRLKMLSQLDFIY
ncbi:MAG TPA: pyruvate ferredoxin oxidoreductase [Thermoprotei archaeon]|nr:pyruvate ferredoxin oxidoreductase [Thermoprotei archaeon]